MDHDRSVIEDGQFQLERLLPIPAMVWGIFNYLAHVGLKVGCSLNGPNVMRK